MQRNVLFAILVGIIASGSIYYVWCSLQWKEASQQRAAAEAAEAEKRDNVATATPATALGGQQAGASTPTSILTAPVVAPQNVFTSTGNLNVDARVSNTFVQRTGETNMHVAMVARTGASAGGDRLPANVVLVVDRSGSMRGERIRHAQSSAEFLVNSLRDGDSISLVTYSNNALVELPPTVLTGTSRVQVANAIRSISIGGGTCVSCGIDSAATLVASGFDGPQRMILLSDGQANEGEIRDAFLRASAQKIEQEGAALSTIGVGLDYNEDLMTEIAVGGNGRHYFVEDPAVLSTTLRAEVEQLDNMVAQTVVANFRLPEGVRFVKGFDRDFQTVGNQVLVSLGDMPANTERTALFEVAVRPGVEVTSQPVTDLSVSWNDVATKSPSSVAGTLAVVPTDDPAKIFASVDPVVAARVEQAAIAEAVAVANQQIQLGNIEEAQNVIRQQRQSSWSANTVLGSSKLDAQINEMEAIEKDLAKPAAKSMKERKKRAKKNAEFRRNSLD